VPSLLMLLLVVGAEALGQPEAGEITIIGPAGRQSVPISVFSGVPMLPLDEIMPFVDGSIRGEGDSVEIAVGDRVATIAAGRSMVAAPGKWELLSAPARAIEGRWFVPLDFLSKVLPILAVDQLTYRADERLLVIGESFPRVSVRSDGRPAFTRVVLESTTPVPYEVTQADAQIRVVIQAAYLETDFQIREVKDGIVETIRLARGEDSYLLTLDLGERFGTFKASELRNPDRIVIDLFRSRVPVNAVGVEAPPVPDLEGPPVPPVILVDPPMPDLPVPSEGAQRDLRTIALDPGHGGAETGATGPTGLLEKDVTLAIARKLRELLENRLGVRVIFTRDEDRDLPLDERTSVANNNKSDLFISIHVNASPRRNAKGSSVYFLSQQASDEESRRVAAAENAPSARAASATNRDLQFILWDMAQTASLNESSVLAEILLEELLGSSGEENNRGIKQAPFRVLMGATMPSVLVEVGFITNPDEERLLRTSKYQEELAQAIFRGVLRYKERYERTSSMSGSRGGRERR
jgi:N-acetylmuramoyl-L-alanine amidase